MNQQKVSTEEFQINGEMLLAKIKEIIHHGNIRRIIIKDEKQRVILDLPLTIGVVGAFLAPQLAAIGAIAALVTNATVIIEKVEE
jgi:hypothetical protein